MISKELVFITSKALIAGMGTTYDKAIETTKDTFNNELQTAYGKKMVRLYCLLETFAAERQKLAEKRYRQEWHNTILCTCRKCDPQHMWRTKGLKELKRSWM